MFVTFDFYLNDYRGTLVTSADFPSYELQARFIVKGYCLKRDRDYEKVLDGAYADALRLTMCEIIDSIKNYDTLLSVAKKGQQRQLSGIASESVKDHSISIQNGDNNSVTELEQSTKQEQIRIMQKYLYPTNLLYRGL